MQAGFRWIIWEGILKIIRQNKKFILIKLKAHPLNQVLSDLF